MVRFRTPMATQPILSRLKSDGQPVSSARARAELGTELSPLDDSLDRAHAWFVLHSYVPRAQQKEMTDESA
jgi:hypothetical protein